MKETKTKLNIPLALLVIAASVPMYLCADDGITVGGITLVTRYFIAAFIILVGVFYFLARPDLKFGARITKDALVLFTPYLVAFVISVPLWIFTKAEFRVLTRGTANTIYQLLGLLFSMSLAIMFREKAPMVHLAALVITYMIVVVTRSIIPYGLGTFLRDYVTLITTFANTTTKSMYAVEYHDMSFALGIMAMYFLFCKKKRPVKAAGFMISILLFSLCLKRIAVAGMAISILLAVFCGLFPKKARNSVIRIIFFAIMLAIIAYVAIVRMGIFREIMDKWGVNTMGRNEVYEFAASYYTFSPLYLGRGLGFVERLFQSFPVEYTGTNALHNDFMRQYIELGFWGYLIWAAYSCIYRPAFFVKKRNTYTATMLLCVTAFCFVTYATDNTYYYYALNTVFFTVILSCASLREEREE